MPVPKLIKVRQRFDNTCIGDVEAAVRYELQSLGLNLKHGARIAITAGSRGIDNIPLVLGTVASFIKESGAEPFFVPAMGSHGGATAGGQIKVLDGLGLLPEYLGAPIKSSMDTVVIGSIDVGISIDASHSGVMPVHMDKFAYEADGIIVINRVKPHTSFHAEVESGLQKMLAIGLGKAVQAANIHNYGTRGLRELIAPVAQLMLAKGKIIAGLGIVENAYDRLMHIKGLMPEMFVAGERELLAMARRNMPRLPVDKLDILIVEQMGKNFSGTGMDTNIIGRLKIQGEAEPGSPAIKRIAVLDLSEASAGNVYGIGLADFTTKKLVDSIDYEATYANMLTTNFFERVKIPYIAADENAAVEAALKTCALESNENARIIRIKNTLDMENIQVSQSVFEEIKDKVEVIV